MPSVVWVVAWLDAACFALLWLKPGLWGLPATLSDPSVDDAILLVGLVMYAVSLVVLPAAIMVPHLRVDLRRQRHLWAPLVVIAVYVARCTYELLDVLRGNI